MPDEKFKMPLSSYEELSKVIKSYGHFSQPANLDEVSRLAGLHRTVISRNAGFLTSVGILEPGAKKLATSVGRELARALEHEMPNEIRLWWRRVIEQTEFLTKLLTAIKIRGGMDQSTLEAHIAYSAGQPKKSQFMTGARTIIDILRAAEAVREADGKIVFADLGVPSEYAPPGEKEPSRRGVEVKQLAEQQRPGLERVAKGASYAIQIQVNVSCTTADLDTLAEKLRKLVRDLSEEQREVQDNETPEK
jgi:hypothetical protein